MKISSSNYLITVTWFVIGLFFHFIQFNVPTLQELFDLLRMSVSVLFLIKKNIECHVIVRSPVVFAESHYGSKTLRVENI